MMFQTLRRMMAESATLKIECEDEAFKRLGPDATPYDIRRRLVADAVQPDGRACGSEAGVQDCPCPTNYAFSNSHAGMSSAVAIRSMLSMETLRSARSIAPTYNAGPGRVAALGRVPDIAETRAYVAAVIDCYMALSVGREVRTARECRAAGGTP
jgi:hypothetical protein